jgi:hypothetical protein
MAFGKPISYRFRAGGSGERRLLACSRRQRAYGTLKEKMRSCAKQLFGELLRYGFYAL